jgi:hypothetical protein
MPVTGTFPKMALSARLRLSSARSTTPAKSAPLAGARHITILDLLENPEEIMPCVK